MAELSLGLPQEYFYLLRQDTSQAATELMGERAMDIVRPILSDRSCLDFLTRCVKEG